jgi:hypothetical protein
MYSWGVMRIAAQELVRKGVSFGAGPDAYMHHHETRRGAEKLLR